MKDAKVDAFFNGKAYGSVAQRLVANGMNVNTLRPYEAEDGKSYITVNGKPLLANTSTLRKEEWMQMDEAILVAARQRLIGVADLNSRGLTYNISNGLGTTVLEYEDTADLGEAEMNMDAVTRGRDDRPVFDIKYLPLPVIHKSFHFNIRALSASRTTGAPLDTTTAALCGRSVAEKVENILFNGSSTFNYGGGIIYGYADFPSRLTGSLTAPWDQVDSSSASGETILADILAMKQALISNRFFGPYMVYIPTAYETALDEDFKANSDKTIRQRLLEVGNIIDVKVADFMTTNSVIMVQMTSDVVRMVNGLGITPVEWDSEGGMIFHYKVMTIQVPQLRADQNGRTGIARYTE
ncbi:MAG: hypothetical protein DRI61_16495 [Chloroflexi bacterium]|nr:MAG: hypothetical protein DRI61_16495 [Chloroflexota bacterium]